jgi:hypothetical protein
MSKIALTPNASGTGVFTISSPATNTNRTLTLPDEAGSIVVNTATGIDVTGTVTATEFNIAEFSTSTNVLQSNTGETGARLRASVSSAGFPTFAFSDDNNTGIFRPAADTLGFGTAGTERLRIDSSGRVTMPYQPAFLAILTVNNQSGDLVMTDVQTNVGGHYNSGTGRFTAPVAGTYYFAITSLEQGGSGAIRLKKNGALFGAYGYMEGLNATAVVIGIHTLNSGDYVSAYAWNGAESNYTTFSGHLIG